MHALMNHRARRAFWASCVALFACLAAAVVSAAPPTGHIVQAYGTLYNQAGGGISDGNYTITVRLYAAFDAKFIEYKEISVATPVKNGQFLLNIGSSDPASLITAQLLGKFQTLWLGIQIENEPELPRVQIAWTPYAIVADSANSLNCTNCVAMTNLAAEVINSFVKTSTLSDVGSTGNYNDLTSKPVLAQVGTQCKVGEYAIGTANNGALLCQKIDVANFALLNAPDTFAAPIGIGKAATGTCAFDVASTLGAICIDGSPATVVRTAASQVEMDKLKKDSQIVYRSDNGEAYLYRKGVWRKFAFAPMCGDGLVDPGEECDDANTTDTDGCSNLCKLPIQVNVTFTSCGATGTNGPTAGQCTTAYASGALAGKVTVTTGIQTWTVPTNGTYRIEVWGGQGAANTGVTVGGKGARLRGDFVLKVGQVLKIVVGQMGAKTTSGGSSGGGGGTFVALSDNTPLLIGGGGGGLGGAGTAAGVSGTISNAGTKDSAGKGTPGTAGDGGLSGSLASANGGGGGGGLTGDGKVKQLTSGYPGKAFVNGGVGGLSRMGLVSGGFGGGGGCQDASGGGGGGGGYSGGTGGQFFNAAYGGGGGGGSYNSGTSQDGADGVQAGDGKVTVLKL